MTLLRDPAVLLLLCVLLAWGVYSGLQPPQPLPAETENSVFSAERAEILLHSLYFENLPHVSGSEQNAVLRDRILAMLETFGYEPEVQSRFHCRPEIGSCSPLENIVAVRKGEKQGSAILLTAHYDSTWAGPGVADDGAGVAAVLEIARMLASAPSLEHDLIFLFTDAEELGLLGADAFAKHHELFANVRFVINLEARGAGGPSIMFETGEGNRRIIRSLEQSLERPIANSLSYEVYKRMPNDTDFSVYRDYNKPGFNFAFVGQPALYHSRIDDLSHLDLGSLQHHGQNAWAILHAMDARYLEKVVSSEDAAYIDLFGHDLLHYPASSAAGVALLLSVLTIIAIRKSYPRQVTIRQVFWTLVAIIMLMMALPAAGWLLSWPLGRWPDMHPLQHPFSWLGRATLLLATLWLISRTSAFLTPRASTGSVMGACWSLMILFAITLAYVMPVISYLAILPLLMFFLGLILDGFRWKKSPRLLFSSLFGFLAAAYLGFYYFFLLDAVLNFNLSHFKVIPLILPVIPLLPLLVWYADEKSSGKRLGNVLLVLIVAGCVGQQFVPGYTADSPRDMALVYRQDSNAENAWLVLESLWGTADEDYAARHEFQTVRLVAPYGRVQEVLAREISPIDLAEVKLVSTSVQETENPTSRKHHVVELEIPPGVRHLRVFVSEETGFRQVMLDGLLALDTNEKTRQKLRGNYLRINRPKAGPMRLEIELANSGDTDLQVEAWFDLPELVLAPYMDDWPLDAQPAMLGPRALKKFTFRLDGQE